MVVGPADDARLSIDLADALAFGDASLPCIGQINAEAGIIRWAHNHEPVDTSGFDHFGQP